ncbi:MAG: T9SS type A sorting domain-containing protein [Bacteroidetes bacterium]|nr:T9SS type A sorting domain-containing protein [Bacteroidota bacterium]
MAHAQCDIDFDFGELEYGVSPDPVAGETFETGMIDEGYFDVLHILIPTSTEPIDPNFTAALDSVAVMGDFVDAEGMYFGVVFTDTMTQEQFFAEDLGLEVTYNNNGSSPTPNMFLSGNQYCASIQGMPNRAGIYRIKLDVLAYLEFIDGAFPFSFDNFTLRVNCPLLAGVEISNANSLEGTQGSLTATLADGVVATEIAWFNASGVQIGTGESVTVDNPGTFAVMVTTEDCQSLFGGFVVIDAGLDCTMSAYVDVVNAEEGEDNGSATVIVDGSSGPWTATWYSASGLLLGSGPSIDNLAEGQYSVLVVDSIGCSVEVESFDVLTGLEEFQVGAWTAFPNPASHTLTLAGLPRGSSWAMLTLDGRVVQSGMARVQDVIRLSGMQGGIYLIRVASSEGVSTQRVLVQH